MNRGSGAEAVAQEAVSGASMRPRFMNRGSADLRGRSADARPASMRPRFMNRGSLTKLFDLAERFLLQ